MAKDELQQPPLQRRAELGRYNNTFFEYKSDARCAAYFGFDDVADFNRLRLHPITLGYYLAWIDNITSTFAIKSDHKAFDILESQIDLNVEFPGSMKDLMDKYRRRDGIEAEVRAFNSGQDRNRKAGLLYNLSKFLENKDMYRKNWKVNYDGFAAQIRQKKGCTLPPFSDLNTGSTKLPQFGPRTDIGEHSVERWLRAYILLRSTAHLFTTSEWSKVTTRTGGIFISRTVLPNYIPQWMRVVDTRTSTAAQSSLLSIVSGLPAVKVTLNLDRGTKNKYDTQLNSHITDYLELECLDLPRSVLDCKSDPRKYLSGTQWRDQVRYQLHFQDLKINFRTIHMILSKAGESSENLVVYDKIDSSRAVTWGIVQSQLEQYKPTDIECRYTLMVLEKVNSDRYPWEHGDVPQALKDDFLVDATGDIIHLPKSDNSTLNATPAFVDTSAVATLRTTDGNLQQEQFLRSLFDFIGKAGLEKLPAASMIDLLKSEITEKTIKHYSGYDISDLKQRKLWQLEAIEIATKDNLDSEDVSPAMHISRNDQKTIDTAQANQEGLYMQHTGTSDAQDEQLYFSIQSAFGGTNTDVGPFVDLCRIILRATHAGTLRDEGKMDVWKVGWLRNQEATFLDSQLNCAVFQLLTTYGTFSPPGVTTQEKNAIKTLAKVPCNGSMVIDGTGLGKTRATLLFLALRQLFINEKAPYQPTIICVPSAVVLSQWVSQIRKLFPELDWVVCHGEGGDNNLVGDRWVSAAAMSAAPANLSRWPAKYQYLWNQTSKKAGHAIIFTTYDSLKLKLLEQEEEEDESEDEEEEQDIEHPVKKARVTFQQRESNTINFWAGRIKGIVLDESHYLRHMKTQRFMAVWTLNAKYHWFLSATPEMNSQKDMIAPLSLLWRSIDQGLKTQKTKHVKAVRKWIRKTSKLGWKTGWAKTDTFQRTDKRRLICLNIKLVKYLINGKYGAKRKASTAHIAKYYRYIGDLVAIRRCSASILKKDVNGGTISLQDMMPKHHTTTVDLPWRPKEAVEFQVAHRAEARSWYDKLASRRSDSKPPNVAREWRQMLLLSAGLHLARFERAMVARGFSLEADHIDFFRRMGMSPVHFLSICHRRDDPELETAFDVVAFLAYGSPKMRQLFKLLREVVIDPIRNKKKLILTEDLPANAWYWQLGCIALGVEASVLHAELNDSARRELVERFNNENNSLKVLILLYNVSNEGINLDNACSTVAVMTAAVNAAVECQALGRIDRVSQNEECHIYRYRCQNSNDGWRDSRQADKSFGVLLSHSLTNATKAVLVKLLNRANASVRVAHESILGKKLLNGKATLPLDFRAGIVVQDPVSTENLHPLDTDTISAVASDHEGDSSNSKRQKLQDFDSSIDRLPNVSTQHVDENDEDKNVDVDLDVDDDEDEDSGESEDFEDSEDSKDSEAEQDKKEGEEPKRSEDRRAEASFDVPTDTTTGHIDKYNQVDNGLDSLAAFLAELPVTIADLKVKYRKLIKAEKEAFDYGQLNLRRLLALDPAHVYTDEDLEESHILERALRLLYAAKFGSEDEGIRLGPHITYDMLPIDVQEAVQAKQQKEQDAVQSAIVERRDNLRQELLQELSRKAAAGSSLEEALRVFGYGAPILDKSAITSSSMDGDAALNDAAVATRPSDDSGVPSSIPIPTIDAAGTDQAPSTKSESLFVSDEEEDVKMQE